MTQNDLIILSIVIGLIYIGFKYFVRQKPVPKLRFTIDHINIEGEIDMVQLSSTQQVRVKLTPKNRLGGPASVEAGSVIVQSSDPSVVAIDKVEGDETEFYARATGPGVAQVDITADADLGEGVTPISTFFGVEVVPAGASGFGVEVGEVEEQNGPEA